MIVPSLMMDKATVTCITACNPHQTQNMMHQAMTSAEPISRLRGRNAGREIDCSFPRNQQFPRKSAKYDNFLAFFVHFTDIFSNFLRIYDDYFVSQFINDRLVPFVICLHTVQQSRDAIWNAESRGSREHVLEWKVDAPTGRGTFGDLVCSAKFPRNLSFFRKKRREILYFFPRNTLCIP